MQSLDALQWIFGQRDDIRGFARLEAAEISFPPTTAKFLRVKLNADKGGKYWSIHELQVYGRDVK